MRRLTGTLGVLLLTGTAIGGGLAPTAARADGSAPDCDGSVCTVTFDASGDLQTWPAPSWVTSVNLAASGGEGGGESSGGSPIADGAEAGFSSATVPVGAGETLSIAVGQAGNNADSTDTHGGLPVYGGGGAGGNGNGNLPGGAGGGGGSFIFDGDGTLLLAAGGGGGVSISADGTLGAQGGPGGGPNEAGSDGQGGNRNAGGGDGATTSGPGDGGGPGDANDSGAQAGDDGGGITSAPASLSSGGTGGLGAVAGGGGGGGYYGGGGGGGSDGNSNTRDDGGAGGGGSGYAAPDATNVTGVTGGRFGDGSVTVSYATEPTTTQVSVDTSGIEAGVFTATGDLVTGSVDFTDTDGTDIGSAPLQNGIANLPVSLSPGGLHEITASYDGNGTGFANSSGTTVRVAPDITASVVPEAPDKFGWYDTPVTVTFTCTATSAKIKGKCPPGVALTKSAANQSASATITAVDGGAATVTESRINIDRVAPTVKIDGVKSGASLIKKPAVSCVAHDALSGVASCKLATVKKSTKKKVDYTVTATALDRAGNTATATAKFQVKTKK